MNDENSSKRNRVYLTVPYSLLEKVDAHVEKMLEDGESRDTANRSSFAKNALMNGFIIDAIFGIMKETIDSSKVVRNEMLLDPDWPKEMKERVAGKLLEFFK